ncbi:MAG: class I SAM-dependent methyltransferase, partial [Candidatus Nanoarchaeia archaeon]
LIRASSSYHIEQNVFLKSVTGSLLKMFNEKEAEIITTRILAEINEEIMKKLDDWYTEYYDPEKREFKKIVKELDPKGKRILEVGCGTGRITKEVGKVAKEVVAIDNNGSAVRYTKEKLSRLKNVTIEEGDVTKLKYKENEFDGILVSWAGLHYAADKEKIVKKLYAMLKPKGRIVILEAYADSEYIAILNKLKLKPSKIKEKQAELKEKLYSQFGNLKEEIVTTYYDFPSYAKLEEKFKIELGYEEGVNWTEEESKKLKVYMEKKKDLKVGEAFVVIVGEK